MPAPCLSIARPPGRRMPAPCLSSARTREGLARAVPYHFRMRIDDILATTRPCFSFDFFPPRTDDGQRNLEDALAELRKDGPEYVSVTYGAGGSTRERTVEVTKSIKQDLGLEAMAHLSCVGEPVDRIREILDEIEAAGIDNVLALRGDPPRGQTEWTPH